MDKEEIDYIKANKRFKRTYKEYVDYIIFALVFPFSFCSIGISMFYSYIKFNRDETTLLLFSIFLNVIGLSLFFFVFKRLRQNESFEVIKNNKNLDLKEIENNIQSEFKIDFVSLVSNKYKAITLVTKKTAFSWGENITIIIDQDNLLVNSRPVDTSDFPAPRQPLTITKDRKNIKKLRQLFS